jgi:hypothetical protein
MSKKTNNQKEETVISAGKYNALVKENEALKKELEYKNKLVNESKKILQICEEVEDKQLEFILELQKSNKDLIATNKQSLAFIKMLLNNSDLNE